MGKRCTIVTRNHSNAAISLAVDSQNPKESPTHFLFFLTHQCPLFRKLYYDHVMFVANPELNGIYTLRCLNFCFIYLPSPHPSLFFSFFRLILSSP